MSPMVFFGLIASVALLAAFAMLNLGKLTPQHYTYQALNFVGAGFLEHRQQRCFHVAGEFLHGVCYRDAGVRSNEWQRHDRYVNRREGHDGGDNLERYGWHNWWQCQLDEWRRWNGRHGQCPGKEAEDCRRRQSRLCDLRPKASTVLGLRNFR